MRARFSCPARTTWQVDTGLPASTYVERRERCLAMADQVDDTPLQRSPEVVWRRLLDGVLVLGTEMSEPQRVTSPGDVLWVTLGAAALNALANYALIFGNFGMPELGARGAAIASVIMNTSGALALVAYILWKLPEQELFVRLWRPDWAALRQVFRLGWPISLTSLAEVGLFSMSSSS